MRGPGGPGKGGWGVFRGLEGEHFARRVAHSSGCGAGEMSWGEGPGKVKTEMREGGTRGLLREGERAAALPLLLCAAGRSGGRN